MSQVFRKNINRYPIKTFQNIGTQEYNTQTLLIQCDNNNKKHHNALAESSRQTSLNPKIQYFLLKPFHQLTPKNSFQYYQLNNKRQMLLKLIVLIKNTDSLLEIMSFKTSLRFLYKNLNKKLLNEQIQKNIEKNLSCLKVNYKNINFSLK